MKSKISNRLELLISIGVGIVIEGLIFFAMLCILPFREAISYFLTMVLASLIMGTFIVLLYMGDQEKRNKICEQS